MREEGASSDSEEELACLFPTVRQMVGIQMVPLGSRQFISLFA